jgi:hypothetical protein
VPLQTITALDALRKTTVIYNGPNGRKYGATVEGLSTRGATPAVAVTATTTTVGGSIASTTATSYRYTVVTGTNGESLPSTGAGVTTGATETNSVQVSIPPVTGADYYVLYGRTSGAEAYLGTIGAVANTTVTFNDIGQSIQTSTTVPSGAVTAGSVALRIHTRPGDRVGTPRLLTLVPPATSVNQPGRYEYYRV